MENLIVYLCKSAAWIAIFWLIYWLFLRKEIFFGFNRGFLLAGLFFSFVVALCRYRYSVEIELPAVTGRPGITIPATVSSINRMTVITGIYLLGVALLLIYRLTGLYKIRQLIRQQKRNSTPVPRLIETTGIRSSFAFFHYIFMNTASGLPEREKKLILEHEMAHVEQRHWIDLLLVQIVCCLQWFNPFAWLYFQSIKQNHEFLADRDVIRKGNSPAVYSAALINGSCHAPVFVLTNSFSYYNKFKRISMMKKNVSRPAKKLAVLFILPAFAAFLWAFAQPEYTSVAIAGQEPVAGLSLEGDSVVIYKTLVTCQMDSLPNDSTVSGIKIRLNYRQAKEEPLILVDGKEITSSEMNAIDVNSIRSISVLKDTSAIQVYEKKGKHGVILIQMK
jgi:hypothetical protein